MSRRRITRRDFLNGTRIGLTGAALSPRIELFGRQPLGRIAIANSDAAASAYTDAAIDQAHRAVRELLAKPSSGAGRSPRGVDLPLVGHLDAGVGWGASN